MRVNYRSCSISLSLCVWVLVHYSHSMIFIPTLPTPEGSQVEDKGSGRFDLDVQFVTEEDSPGVLTIGTESPWGVEGADETSGSSQEAPYGTWKSPISGTVAVSPRNVVVEPPQVDPVTGFVFWCSQLNSDGHRIAVFHFDPATRETVQWTAGPYDVRTRVNEQGGGSFTIYNNTLYFSNGPDGAIYRQRGPTGAPVRLTTQASPGRSYADGVFSPQWNVLFYVVEDVEPVSGEVEYRIVTVDGETGEEAVVVSHANFFASPRVSEDGQFLVWLQWNHPRMPWDETKMFVGEIKNKRGKVAITKFFQHGSMMMPSFDPNNELYYVHDTTGWWNLYRVTRRGFEINVTPESQEVGWPMWKLGRKAYDVNPSLGASEAVVICGHDLTVVDLRRGTRSVLKTGYTSYTLGVVYSRDGSKVYVVAGDGVRYPALVEVDIRSGEARPVTGGSDVKVLEASGGSEVTMVEAPGGSQVQVDGGYLSTARPIQFPTSQGDFAYGYLYMPKNRDYHAPVGSKPPLLVKVHEGPTGAASTALSLEYQYFTSRGYALLDVDYRGSTGYGKLYRNKLNELWGVYDVDDVLAGARHLVEEGLVDPDRLCIDGASTAAYTTLSALTITDSLFKAGASYYGVWDPEMMAKDTRKVMRNYMEALIGNLDKHKDRYVTRSPIRNYERLHVPTIFFHGEDDQVVPASQARGMYELLKNKGLPTDLLLFQGEGHGFTKTETKIKTLVAEFCFFAQVFNLTSLDVPCRQDRQHGHHRNHTINMGDNLQ
ncbi:uncharacterized protein [Procambarus clarkii]|uniref:uncharacterized protein n=1 Tax=Procambarus clarkii TaxID=6728 RepID=UPI0037435CF0